MRGLHVGVCCGVLVGVLIAAGVAAAEKLVTSKLRGEIFVAGKTPIDRPQSEPKNTHAYMTVTGASAMRMYQNMRAMEEENLCEVGKKLKQAGPLMCSITADRRGATCDFSIDLVDGKLSEGKPC